VNQRGSFLLALLAVTLISLPAFANNYFLSLATFFLLFAYTGQAWNIMMGFAGQLSLGHSLYLGVGAYTAGALYFHYGLSPWIGVWLAIVVCIALGAFIGALAFRCDISGVYFTLLTIAFAEFARIGFDHFAWVGGSAGLFLKVAQQNHIDWLNLRGPPAMYYYIALILAALAFATSAWLLRQRPGFYWQAIRENEEAARSLGIDSFRWKIFAVVTSAAMTAVAGVFLAFYYNNLFPEQIFSINRSVEMILGPIIGGLGTLFGPLVGAALMIVISEGAAELVDALGWNIPGVKQLIYGAILFAVVVYLPHGVWPSIARKLKLQR
jgi:branched-chain amino acid transport system permease protein